MNYFRTFVAAGALFAALTAAALAQQGRGVPENLKARPGDLKPGDPAPDFTLKDLQGQTTVTLSQLKGKPVVLLFGSCS